MNPVIERLQAMLDRGQDNMLLRFSLGKAHAEEGDAATAVVHLRAALAHDPGYSVAWQWLGKALLAQGDEAGAREAWATGLQAAQSRGDQQVVKTLQVFLRRLDRPRP
ncbi:tetratricopeptide repeat protein [Bordetella sp. 2513F-2]